MDNCTKLLFQQLGSVAISASHFFFPQSPQRFQTFQARRQAMLYVFALSEPNPVWNEFDLKPE